MKNTTRLITPIEYLIALFIIVTMPVGAFASSDKPAKINPAVTQVKDSLRQIAEAATLWEKAGGCSMRDCTDVDKLVAAGKLAKAPQVPSGIDADGTPPYYSATELPMGGCGPGNIGAPQTANLALKNVSEQFCKDYNNSVGLGSIIVKNCSSGGDCTASRSNNSYHFPMVNSPSFCFLRNDIYVVVWMTTISSAPCPN